MDALTARHVDSLSGSYDCVDRIVLNAYSLGHNAGGFRVWWRSWHADGDDSLDNTHLMRLAGRFSRRVRGWARANGVPVVDCSAGERKHRIAEDYLRDHTVGVGVFLILVARAPATVWKVTRSATSGKIRNLEKTRQFVNHYSFHIMDPTWGHLTIKMSGHPPFGAQVILNGHEYVACTAHAAEIGFAKEGNCFTGIGDPKRLAQIADTLSQPGTAGRLGQVIDAWIYTACLCFGLDLAEQQASHFNYSYAVDQVEYSRNLIFDSGARMERLFDAVIDRVRTKLDLPAVRTLFGVGHRPHRADPELSPRQGVVILRPHWNLTIFKIHFGLLTLKAYSKGERVLRFEAIVHNTKTLRTAAPWASSAPSSPDWPAWSTGSPPCSTASTLGSCPTASSTSSPPPARPVPFGSAASTPTSPGPAPRWPRSPRSRSPPTGSASPTSPPPFTPGPARTTPPGRPPTTCGNSAARISSSNPDVAVATRFPTTPPEPSARSSPSATA